MNVVVKAKWEELESGAIVKAKTGVSPVTLDVAGATLFVTSVPVVVAAGTVVVMGDEIVFVNVVE